MQSGHLVTIGQAGLCLSVCGQKRVSGGLLEGRGGGKLPLISGLIDARNSVSEKNLKVGMNWLGGGGISE